MRSVHILALSALLGATAFGAVGGETSLVRTGNPDNWCRNGLFSTMSEQYQVAEVLTPKPLLVDYVADDKATPCPNDEAGKCVSRGGKLPKGTRLVISKDYGHFTCVFDPKSGSAGWIDRAAIRRVPTPAIRSGDWIGTWGFYDNKITVKPSEGKALNASGEAYWYGQLLDDGSRNTHMGDFDFTGEPKVDRLSFLSDDPSDCAAELIHLGAYLVVRDNHRCGGTNVSFDGVYRRQKPGKH